MSAPPGAFFSSGRGGTGKTLSPDAWHRSGSPDGSGRLATDPPPFGTGSQRFNKNDIGASSDSPGYHVAYRDTMQPSRRDTKGEAPARNLGMGKHQPVTRQGGNQPAGTESNGEAHHPVTLQWGMQPAGNRGNVKGEATSREPRAREKEPSPNEHWGITSRNLGHRVIKPAPTFKWGYQQPPYRQGGINQPDRAIVNHPAETEAKGSNQPVTWQGGTNQPVTSNGSHHPVPGNWQGGSNSSGNRVRGDQPIPVQGWGSPAGPMSCNQPARNLGKRGSNQPVTEALGESTTRPSQGEANQPGTEAMGDQPHNRGSEQPCGTRQGGGRTTRNRGRGEQPPEPINGITSRVTCKMGDQPAREPGRGSTARDHSLGSNQPVPLFNGTQPALTEHGNQTSRTLGNGINHPVTDSMGFTRRTESRGINHPEPMQ
eukprot:gene29676-5092_t